MAAQQVDSNSGGQASAGTSFAPTRGTSPSAGELEFLFVTWGVTGQANPFAPTVPSGWTQLAWVERTTGATEGMAAYYRKAAGGESTAIGTFSGYASTKLAWIYKRYSGGSDPATTPPEATTANSAGLSDPPALTPSWGAADTRWVAACAMAQTTQFTAAPANYGNFTTEISGTAGSASTNGVLATADRANNVATEDPGNFTNAASVASVSVTVGIKPGTTGISGSGSPVLGALSAVAAGAVAIAAAGAASIALAVSGAGAVAVQGSGSRTLAAPTSAATGAVAIQGSGSSALASPAASGAGTVGDSVITGDGAPTLPSPAATGAGQVGVAGTGAPALLALSGAGAAVAPIGGTGSAALAALAGTGTAKADVAGTGSPSLATFAGSAAGTVSIAGSGSPGLFTLIAAGDGNSTGAVNGSGAPTLPSPTAVGAGTVPVTGSGAEPLASFAGAGAGVVPVAGSGAAPLASLAGAGTASAPVSGSGSFTFVLSMAGTVQLLGDALLAAQADSAVGSVTLAAQPSGSVVLSDTAT